ncbi:hypothetical protein VTO42DRAFT_3356 [Malbranchea cinnamomea]
MPTAPSSSDDSEIPPLNQTIDHTATSLPEGEAKNETPPNLDRSNEKDEDLWDAMSKENAVTRYKIKAGLSPPGLDRSSFDHAQNAGETPSPSQWMGQGKCDPGRPAVTRQSAAAPEGKASGLPDEAPLMRKRAKKKRAHVPKERKRNSENDPWVRLWAMSKERFDECLREEELSGGNLARLLSSVNVAGEATPTREQQEEEAQKQREKAERERRVALLREKMDQVLKERGRVERELLIQEISAQKLRLKIDVLEAGVPPTEVEPLLDTINYRMFYLTLLDEILESTPETVEGIPAENDEHGTQEAATHPVA